MPSKLPRKMKQNKPSTKNISFEKTTSQSSLLPTSKRISSLSQSSLSDKFANFPYLPAKTAVRKGDRNSHE